MKNYLFNENYMFLKPHFLNSIISGYGYENLYLTFSKKENFTNIKIDSFEEYFYKNKTLLKLITTINEETEVLNQFIKDYTNNPNDYLLSFENKNFFSQSFLKDIKIDENNFNFIFEKNENEIKIHFFILV